MAYNSFSYARADAQRDMSLPAFLRDAYPYSFSRSFTQKQLRALDNIQALLEGKPADRIPPMFDRGSGVTTMIAGAAVYALVTGKNSIQIVTKNPAAIAKFFTGGFGEFRCVKRLISGGDGFYDLTLSSDCGKHATVRIATSVSAFSSPGDVLFLDSPATNSKEQYAIEKYAYPVHAPPRPVIAVWTRSIAYAAPAKDPFFEAAKAKAVLDSVKAKAVADIVKPPSVLFKFSANADSLLKSMNRAHGCTYPDPWTSRRKRRFDQHVRYRTAKDNAKVVGCDPDAKFVDLMDASDQCLDAAKVVTDKAKRETLLNLSDELLQKGVALLPIADRILHSLTGAVQKAKDAIESLAAAIGATLEDARYLVVDAMETLGDAVAATKSHASQKRRDFLSRVGGTPRMSKSVLVFVLGAWACFSGLSAVENYKTPAPAPSVLSTNDAAVIAQTMIRDNGATANVEIVTTFQIGDEAKTLVKSDDGRRFVIDGIWGATGDTFKAIASQLQTTQTAPGKASKLRPPNRNDNSVAVLSF